MQKFVAFSYPASDHSKQIVLEYMKPAKVLSVLDAFYDTLSEVFKLTRESFDKNAPFKAPIELDEGHIRRFFAKLRDGIYSVQNYVGKTVSTPKELADYYKNVVVIKSFGPDWFAKRFVADLEFEKPGIYLLNDFEPYILQLKQLLPNALTIVSIVDDTVSEPRVPSDYVFHYKSKSQLKREITLLNAKLKGIQNERN